MVIESGAHPPLRVLLVEDSADDAEIVRRLLSRDGLSPLMERVQNADEMSAALEASGWDVVLADDHLPSFSSAAALSLVRARGTDVPVLIVSGAIGRDAAVRALRAGADDVVSKSDLARLVPALRRGLQEAENRRARRTAEEQLTRIRTHDPLTGLVNGDELLRRLTTAVSTIDRTGRPVSFVLLDLDGFRSLNGALGRAAGDAILQGVAVALQGVVSEGETVARIGVDEFGVLLPGLDAEEATRRGARLVETVSALRLRSAGRALVVRASAGVVTITSGDRAADDVLREATAACVAAKEVGGRRVRRFDRSDPAVMKRWTEAEWVPRLLGALDNGRFVLYAQSLLPLRPAAPGERVTEILVRLVDPDGRLVLPGEFVPAAERFGLAAAIDRWVVRDLIHRVSSRPPSPEESGPSTLLVNLSGTTLSDLTFAEDVERMLRRSACDPSRFCFEVTETAVVRDLEAAVDLMARLSRLGCRFALDDFGTGLSSLAYLRSLPVQLLKIDGAFIRGLARDATARAIVESVVHLARALGLGTVAEWVEDSATLEHVTTAGLDYAQGFAIHTPEPF